MITNERQYGITKSEAAKFEAALSGLETAEGHRPDEMRQIMREAIESQLEELRDQLAEFDALRSGNIEVLDVEGLQEIPTALLRARISCGLTQKELARRLGLKEQQIQRYEATRYKGVSWERIQKVAEALGVKIWERLTLPATAQK